MGMRQGRARISSKDRSGYSVGIDGTDMGVLRHGSGSIYMYGVRRSEGRPVEVLTNICIDHILNPSKSHVHS
jgi:hypothetical protein